VDQDRFEPGRRRENWSQVEDSYGKTLFTYGHPLFCAPYAIIGDGG
jgi:hypothetical protein